jgi:hypothetical protein
VDRPVGEISQVSDFLSLFTRPYPSRAFFLFMGEIRESVDRDIKPLTSLIALTGDTP